MRKDILNKVNRFYKERLDFYRGLKEDALAKARENEDIAKIESRIKEIKVLALQGKLTPSIDEEFERLTKQYKELVSAYMPNIKYECEICKDRGVVGHKYCKCFMNRYLEELKKVSNIASLPSFRFADNKIADMEMDDATRDRYAKVYTIMEKFADNYPSLDKFNICMRGQSGAGKTCLVSAIAGRLMERGISVQYITAFDLSELMLQNFLNYKDNSLSSITSTDVLIIDDLGSEPMRNNVNQTYLQSILDSRLSHRLGTIITTNLTPEQLMKKYGERAISRLLNKTDTITIDFGNTPNLRINK